MTDRVLTLRELNRATLSRQLLLERAPVAVSEAVARLLGLQAQVPNPPYIGLWTRLRGFQREDLTSQMEQRRIVRAAAMRSTLHLLTAEDYLQFRRTLEPALVRALNAFFGKRAQGLDIEKLVAAARAYVESEPRATGALGGMLSELTPDRDRDALAYAVRTYLPLVQIPPGGTWGSGSAGAYTTAESWLGRPLAAPGGIRTLVLRYLAAFGPASVADVQAWSGLVKLKEAIDTFKSELRVYRDEQSKELLDLPSLALPPADTPAPPRFLPEYDNLLLAHADRTRVIADEHRPRVFLSAGRVRATFLLDGFVRGAWKIEKTRGAARLLIEPFAPLAADDRDRLSDEADRLVRFVEDRAATFEVRFDGE